MQTELNAVAQQAGSDPEQLCKALQPHFQGIDVPRELSACTKWYEQHSKRTTPRSFVRWLLRCEPSLKSPSPMKGKPKMSRAINYEAALQASIEKGLLENTPSTA